MQTVARSIGTIKSPTAMVTEHEYILDYLRNCDSKTFNQIRDHVIKQREVSEIKPLDVTCGSCSHKHKQAFTLDLASFFGNNS
jgi:bacterioferritin-associated ferredoxin